MATPRKSVSYHLGEALVRLVNRCLTRFTWFGQEHIPRSGGVLIAFNHTSYSDPFIDAYFVSRSGRLPRFMAKEALLRLPVAGRVLRNSGQIPVKRESAGAVDAFDAAVDAINAGECVVIYPEGTLTRDPDLWPMRGKTGAARIALATGCPIIPAAHWGTHDLLPRYSRRLRVRGRTRVSVIAGEPIRLAASPGSPDPQALARATDQLIDALTGLVSQLRDEPPPGRRWDPQHHGQPEIGDFTNPGRRRQ